MPTRSAPPPVNAVLPDPTGIPLPRTIGPYTILEVLGSGGMGVVYRGCHSQTGTPAAIKTVRVLREELLQGIRREVHALSQTRHPGIVRIVGEGLHLGLPWYAMELLEGQPLDRYIARQELEPSHGASAHCPRTAPGQPTLEGSPHATTAGMPAPLEAEPASSLSPGVPPLPAPGSASLRAGTTDTPVSPGGATLLFSALPDGPLTGSPDVLEPSAAAPPRSSPSPATSLPPRLRLILTLIRRLCEPLAFLHGEGLVHRDLKPDNVLVRPDGAVVIVDFGLVERFVREEGRENLSVAGAVAGTLLYMAPEQMLGQPTDARADLYALGCILYELITGAPPFAGLNLQEFVLARLQREVIPPSEHAPGIPLELEVLVLRLLARTPRARLGYADDLARLLEALGAEPLPPAERIRPRAYLYRPEFAGRQEALETLQHAAAGMLSGHSGLVLVGGESGVGKTRLALELVSALPRAEMTILEGSCLPSRGGPSSGAPLEVFRNILQVVADRCRSRGPAETDRLLGFRAPLLARYEPSMVGLPGLEAYPEPAELPADAARLRLFTWLGDVLETLCAEQPLLLILDDVQWADELSLGALEHFVVSRRLEHLPLLVLGLYRSEEIHQPLRRLLDHPTTRRLELSRLEETAIGAIAADMLAMPTLPRPFVSFLTRTSEGNPLFAAEYLRAAVDAGLLYRDEGGRWSLLRTVTEQASLELYERLPLPRSLRALIGRRLEGLSAGAHALLEAAAVLGRELDAALLVHVQARVPADGDTAPDDVGQLEALRELLTRQVLEEAGHDRLRFVHDKLREVAYDGIGDPLRPVLHARAARAIERAVAANPGAWASRLAELGRHWEGAGERALARDCYLEAARREVPRHALAEAERLYRAFLALDDEPAPISVAARRELARQVLCEQGRLREALELALEALARARAIDDAAGEAGTLGELAFFYSNVGELDAAQEAGQAALEHLRRTGDRRATADVLGSLANVAFIRGHPEEALPLCEVAVALSHAEGDAQAEAIDLCDLAILHHALGHLPEAERYAHQGLELARSGGHRSAEARLLACLAGVDYARGEYLTSRRPLLEALEIFREMGDRNWEGRTLRNLGAVSKLLGELEEASRYCEQAIALHRASGDRRWQGVSLEKLAEITAQRGWPDRARTLFQEAIGCLQEIDDRKLEAQATVMLADLETTTGHIRDAIRLYQAATSIQRETGEGARLRDTLYSLARAVRTSGGTADEAEPVLIELETLAHESASPEHLLLATCERGHLARAGGGSAEPWITRIEAMLEQLPAGPTGRVIEAVEALRNAPDPGEMGPRHTQLAQILPGAPAEESPAGP